MALSYVQYPGDGTTRDYNIPFLYISQTHIFVSLDGVATTAFVFTNANTIRLTTAPANGVIVEVRRRTPKDVLLVDFTDGSTLTETQLDLLARQNFFLTQEADDATQGTLTVQPDGSYSAGGRRITSVGDPTGAADVVTKGWAEAGMTSQLAQAISARTAALAAQAAAEAARNTAQTQAGTATTQAGIATTQAGLAATAKTAAEAARDAAATSASAAATSATDAANSLASLSNEVTLAQTARTGAEAARDSAQAARDAVALSRDAAAGSATTAANAATSANSSKTAAETAAANANSSAGAAANSASAASTSAAAAANSATTAGGHATTATTKATEAANSETAANSAKVAAEAARDAAQTWDPALYLKRDGTTAVTGMSFTLQPSSGTGYVDVKVTAPSTSAGARILLSAASGKEKLVQYQDAGLNRWGIGMSTDGEFYVHRFSAAGAYQDSPFKINAANGITSISNGLNVSAINASGAVSANGAITTQDRFYAGNGVSFDLGSAHIVFNQPRARIYQFAPSWFWSWDTGSGQLQWNTPVGHWFYFRGGDGAFVISGNGWKPGGGVWVDTSDARVKENILPYTAGLEEIIRLEPKQYTYRAETGRDPNAVHVGAIAQDIADVMPEMIRPAQETKIGEETITDLLALDASALPWALVNAIKELNSKIAALEARIEELESELP